MTVIVGQYFGLHGAEVCVCINRYKKKLLYLAKISGKGFGAWMDFLSEPLNTSERASA